MPTQAEMLLDRLANLGLRLELQGERLLAMQPALVTEEIAGEIRRYKADIVHLLQSGAAVLPLMKHRIEMLQMNARLREAQNVVLSTWLLMAGKRPWRAEQYLADLEAHVAEFWGLALPKMEAAT